MTNGIQEYRADYYLAFPLLGILEIWQANRPISLYRNKNTRKLLYSFYNPIFMVFYSGKMANVNVISCLKRKDSIVLYKKYKYNILYFNVVFFRFAVT